MTQTVRAHGVESVREPIQSRFKRFREAKTTAKSVRASTLLALERG